MSASAFGQLMVEAANRLRAKYRRSVGLHFDWEPDADPDRSWSAWYHDTFPAPPRMFHGASGEQSLRRLVESLKEEP